jgi:hypothetical protein
VLEQWTRQFRRFLAALSGPDCAFCAVEEHFSKAEIAKLVSATPPDGLELCGRHLAATLAAITDHGSRGRLARTAIASRSDALQRSTTPRCQVCARRVAVQGSLARAVRRLDERVRFQKALEGAPLFCDRHAAQISAGGRAGNFVRIQVQKLSRLSDELCQAELRGRDIEPLIAEALRAFGATRSEPLVEESDICTLPEPSAEELADRAFEYWEEQRRDLLIGKLESELAALRYRNATLEEENRRLALAYNAVDRTRQELERDRSDLMRAAHQSTKK